MICVDLPVCRAIAFVVIILACAVPSEALPDTVVISNERSGDLHFMDRSGATTDVVALCGRPRGMAQGASGQTLFIACSDDHKVIEFDVGRREIVREIPDVPGAMSLALHASSGRLIVSNEGHSSAMVLDTSTGGVLATLATGLEPDGVALSDDGARIFIASENANLVHVYDGESYQPINRLVTGLRPRRLALRGDELWVSSEMGSRVEIFDLNTYQKDGEVVFAPRGFRVEQLTPVDILFDAQQETAFVALGSANHVVFVDAESREIRKYILVGRRPWGLALTPDGEHLFVLNGLSDDVTIIDVARERPIRTSRTGLVPHAVEILE